MGEDALLRASSISPENHAAESIMMDPQKMLRSVMPVRLMSTGCWSAALDDSISDGKEHVQNNPCHPVQEVHGADAAHVEDAAHHDGHWQHLCAMIRSGSGRQLSTIADRRGDRSRNTTTMSFRATMKVRGTRVKKEWRYLRPPQTSGRGRP